MSTSPENGVVVEIPSHNDITNDLSNSDNNETETERIIEMVSVKIENNSNSITSPTTKGRQEKENDETCTGANNIEKSDLLDHGNDLTSRFK